MANNIKVVIKLRPLIKREIESDAKILWKVHDNSISALDGKEHGYVFDRVFPETSSTQDIYDEVVCSIVESSLTGINGTIFAYGQTSSGKTFTMMGDKRNPGIIPLSVYNLFNKIQTISDRDFLLRVSYIEIYNEKIIDLLDLSNKDLKIYETTEAGVKVNAKEELTSSPEDIFRIMKKGEQNRHISGTNMNECSSRSHTIFQIIIESKEHNTDEGGAHDSVNVSHLNLVDLAGSERVSQTGATGQRFKEGININKSLSTLSMVIKQLSDPQGDQTRFVSFRDSKLTRILQTSLGGNAKTNIICAVTPAALEETHSTLKFASQAKSIQNRPEVNTIMSEATMLKKLTKQLSTLQMELDHKKNLETDNKLLTDKIKELHKIILNSIRSTTATDGADAAQARRSERRKTWCPSSRSQPKILPPIREHDISHGDFVRNYVTPTVMRYKSEGKPNPMRQSSLYDIPEDFNVAEPKSGTSSGRHTPEDNIGLIRIVNDEVICLSDDDEVETSAATKIKDCNSPHHICFKPNGTPPCVLKELITKSQQEYEELVEMTTLEKLNPGEVGDIMNKINYNRRLMLKIENALTDQNTMLKETESRLTEKEALLSQKKVEIFDIQKAVEEIEKKNILIDEFETKITDLERLLNENSAQNDSLSQKLKLCEQERDAAVANEKRLASDLKLLEQNITDTEIRLKMTVSKAAIREKELLELLEEVPNHTPPTCLNKSPRNFLDASCDVSFFKSDDDSSMQECLKNPDELLLEIEKLKVIINKNKGTINDYVATVNELKSYIQRIEFLEKSNEFEQLKVTLQKKNDELTQNKELMKRLTDDNESFKTLVFDLRKPDDHKNIIICNLREEIHLLKSSSLEALSTNLSHLMNELNSVVSATDPLTVEKVINTLEDFVFNEKVSFMKEQFKAFVNSLMKHRVMPNENNESTNRLNEQLIQQRLTFINKYEDFQNLLLEINRRLQNMMVIYNSHEFIIDETKCYDSVHKDLAEMIQYVEAIIDESLTNTNDQLMIRGSESKVPKFDFKESLVLKIQNNILQAAFDTSIKQCKEYENITQAIYNKLCIVDEYIKGGILSHEVSAYLKEVLPIDHSDLLKCSDHFKSIEDSISLFQSENISLFESKTMLLSKIDNLASQNKCYEDKLLSVYKTLLEISQHDFDSGSDEINDAITRIDYLFVLLQKDVAEHQTLLSNQTELTMSMKQMAKSKILLEDEIKSLEEQINTNKAENMQVFEKLNKEISVQREASENNSKECKEYKNAMMSMREKILMQDQCYEIDCNQSDICVHLDELIKTIISDLMENKESLKQITESTILFNDEIKSLKEEINNIKTEDMQVFDKLNKQIAVQQEAYHNTSKESKQYKNFIMSVYEKLLIRDQCYEVDSNQIDLCLSLDKLIKTTITELTVNKESLQQLEKNIEKLKCAEREIEDLKKEIEQSNEVVQTLLEKSSDLVNINIDENLNVEPVKSTHIMCQQLDHVITAMQNEVIQARKEMANLQNDNTTLEQLKHELQEAYQNSEQNFTNEIETLKQNNLVDKNEITQSQNIIRALLEKSIKLGDYHIDGDVDEKSFDLMCENLTDIVTTLDSRLKAANSEIVKIQDINKAMQLKQEHQEDCESSKQILLTELETLKQQKCLADNDRIKLLENAVKMLLEKSFKLEDLNINSNLNMNVIDCLQMCQQLDEIITTLHSQLQRAKTEMAQLRDSNNVSEQSKHEIQQAYENSKEIFLTEIETLKQQNDKIKEFENFLQGLLAKSLKLRDGVDDTNVDPVDFAHMCQQLEAMITGLYDRLKHVNTEITHLQDSNKALEQLKEDLQHSEKLLLTEMETLKNNVSIENDKIKHFVHGIHLLLENSVKSIETSGDHDLNVDPTELTHTYERLKRIISSVHSELNHANIEISKLQADNKTLEQMKDELQEANTKSLTVIEALKREKASAENDKGNFEQVENFIKDLRNIFISRIDAVSDETFENSVNLLKHIESYLKDEDEKLKLKNDEIMQLVTENECLKQGFEENVSIEEFGNCITKIYKTVVDIIPCESECFEEIFDNSLSPNINVIDIKLDKLFGHLKLIMKSNINMKETIILQGDELKKNVIENQILNNEKAQFFNDAKNKEVELQHIILNLNKEILNLKEENESLSFEIQLLLPSIEALASKITSHHSNLAIVQATAYAEDKLLRSHLTSLTYRHSRLHEYCEQSLPLMKEQLKSLIPVISTMLPSNQLQETVLLSSRDFTESGFSNSTLKNSNEIGDSLNWCDDPVSARKNLLKTATFLKDDSDVLAERNDIQKLIDDLQNEKAFLLIENESLSTKLIETLQDCDDLQSKVLKLESLLKIKTADADSQTDEVLHQNCNNLIASLRNECKRIQTELAEMKLAPISSDKNTSISSLAENVSIQTDCDLLHSDCNDKIEALRAENALLLSPQEQNNDSSQITCYNELKDVKNTLSDQFDEEQKLLESFRNENDIMKNILKKSVISHTNDKTLIDSLKAELEDNKNKLSLCKKAEDHHLESMRETKRLQEDYDRIKEANSKLLVQVNLSSIQDEIIQKNKETESLKSEIEILNCSCIQKDQEISNLLMNKKLLQQKFDAGVKETSELKMQIENIKLAQNDEIKKLIEAKNCIYREFQHKNVEFQKLILQFEHFKNDDDDFKKAISELESERKKNSNLMDNLDIELKDSKTLNQTLKNDNDVLKITIKELESKYRDSSNLIETLNSQIKCTEHEICEVTKKFTCLKEQYNELKDVNHTLSDQFDKEQKLLESFRNDNNIMKNTVKKSEISHTHDTRLIDSLKAELENNKYELSLCRKTEEHHLELMSKTKRLQEDYDIIKEANSKLLVQVNMLSSMQDEIIQKNKEIESLKSEIEMLNNSCIKKLQEISSSQMNEKLLQQKNATGMKETLELKMQIKNMKTALSDMQDEIIQKNKELESLKSEIHILNNSCVRKDQQISSVQMNNKLLQQKIDASVKETLEIIKLKEKETEKFTKDYENYKKMVGEEKEALSKEIELLMARPQKSAFEEREPNLETEINQLMTNNQALSAELDSVKSKLEETEKTLKEVNKKCDDLDYECNMCVEMVEQEKINSQNIKRSLETKVAELQSEVDSYFNNTVDVPVNASRRKRQSMHDSNRLSIGGDHSLKMESEKDVMLVDPQEKVELLKKEIQEQSVKMKNLEEKYAQSKVQNKPSCTTSTNTEIEWKGIMSFAIDKITYDSEVDKNRQLQAVLEEQKKKIRVLHGDLRRLQENANQSDENTIQIYKNRKQPQTDELAGQVKLLESNIKHKDDVIKELRREVSRHSGAEALLKEVHLNKAEEVSSRRSSGGSPTDFRAKRQHVFDQNRTVSDAEPAEKVSTQEFSASQFYKEVHMKLTRIYKELKMTRDQNEPSPIEAQIIQVLDQISMKNTPIARGSGVIEGQKLSDCYLEIRRLKKVNIKLLEKMKQDKML